MAKNLSFGMVQFDMCPDQDVDGKPFKFMGIKSKNRRALHLTYVANMHQKVTTFALFYTLGPDATKFIIDQTKLSTLAISKDFIPSIIELKTNDTTEKMNGLKNLLVFENDISE